MIDPSLRRWSHSMITQTLLIAKRPVFWMPSAGLLIRLGLQYDHGRKMATMTIRKSLPSLSIRHFWTFLIGYITLPEQFTNHKRADL
jgi:hypothetical protein